MTSALSTVWVRTFWTSTTGVAPVTVTLSCTLPTLISAGMVSVAEPASSRPSRLNAVKPGKVNVSV